MQTPSEVLCARGVDRHDYSGNRLATEDIEQDQWIRQ